MAAECKGRPLIYPCSKWGGRAAVPGGQRHNDPIGQCTHGFIIKAAPNPPGGGMPGPSCTQSITAGGVILCAAA